jgi:hypothetical protein
VLKLLARDHGKGSHDSSEGVAARFTGAGSPLPFHFHEHLLHFFISYQGQKEKVAALLGNTHLCSYKSSMQRSFLIININLLAYEDEMKQLSARRSQCNIEDFA